MGCASSKIDDSPAVILCRERLQFLDQSLHQRFAFSQAHLAYIHSLHSIGLSLHRFFDSSSTSTAFTLPSKNDVVASDAGPGPRPSSSSHLSHSNSNSGSHLHFHSDSDDHLSDHDDHDHDGHLHLEDDSGSESGPEEPDSDLPRKPRPILYEGSEAGANPYPYPYSYAYPFPYPNNGSNNGNFQMNFMRKHVTPSVLYEQKPPTAETLHQFGQPPSSSYYNNPPPPFYQMNNNSNINSNSYDYGYMNNSGGGPPQYVGGNGGWNNVPSTSTPKPQPTPPPPPPPSTSAWDFLNPFESIESSYPPPYTPSRDSREVREEEGIPDLEEEEGDYVEHEVVKEVDGHQKLVHDIPPHHRNHNHGHKNINDMNNVASSSGERKSDGKREEDDGVEVVREEDPVEYEVHMVEKKVVADEAKAEQGKGGGGGGLKSVFEVVKEIELQFERAAASGDMLTKVLEVGKLRYHRKNPAFQVSAKMLNVITPSLPSSSKDSEVSVDVDEDVQLRSLNLSATLQKLYLWEKKLFEEVKAEEKMRVQHDRKLRKLQHLDERGAESDKVHSTRSLVRSLSTKIRIAIQIVDKISAKINKVRDEELWPQLNELIQGLSRMWKAMLECHHSQCMAIDGARGLDAIAFPNNPSDTHLEATLQLERDLINWTCRFTEWVGAQKGFVRALNSWLLKCLFYEPEVTADGVAPFSPGRAGAPPVFVICNQWNQSLERISETSEKEVIDSMHVFAMMVWHFRERDKGEMKQRMTANKDIERKVKNLDREDMKIQKEIQALDKKMVLASGASDGLSLSGHVVYQSDTSSKTSLQAGLRNIFEALDRFTADSVKAYEELLQRSEEVVREHGKVS